MHENSSSHTDAPPTAANGAQVVVLTGASSGIGRATAVALAREGAALALAARNGQALEAVAAECRAAGGRAIAVPTDVTDAAAVRALATAAIEAFGRIDVWINNVGIGAVGRFEDTPIEAHRRVIEANLLGHIHGAHAVLPHFRSRGRGTLINMISVGGWIASPYATAYSASKFGLRGFSESLRAELRDCPGVRLCEVYPTFVDSPGISHGANYTGRSLKPPPGMLDPRRVADQLVRLARQPRDRSYLGAPARPGILAHALAPQWVAGAMMWLTRLALDRAPVAGRSDGNLFEPSRGNTIDGGFRSGGARAGAVLFGLAAAGAAALLLARRGRRPAPISRAAAATRRARGP